jgi:hypothetical protein
MLSQQTDALQEILEATPLTELLASVDTAVRKSIVDMSGETLLFSLVLSCSLLFSLVLSFFSLIVLIVVHHSYTHFSSLLY